jgi:aminoglycoside/choline kinase family phosphotransferase
VQQQVGNQHVTLQPLYGDASRRCYFRVNFNHKTAIVADASAEKTSVWTFVDVANLLAAQHIIVPKIYAADMMHGYLLEEDFGDQSLLSLLNAENVSEFYQAAFTELLKMQTCADLSKVPLPTYDITLLTREWTIFTSWYLQKYRGIDPDKHQTLLDNLFSIFLDVFNEQPQVFVHRDYHSRNLMALSDHHLGVIDFQGAVTGPITYDLVSLLKDCYIAWPKQQVIDWALQMQGKMWQQQNLPQVSTEQFLRWFDLTGLQRHLKVLGLFARQALANDNARYLADMPRVMNYVGDVCQRYPEFTALLPLLETIE